MEFSVLFDAFEHIVEKILSYVEDIQSASLTCKTFYKAVCRNEKCKKVLRMNQNFLHLHFDSIINSSRSFDEMLIYSSESFDDELELSLEQIREVLNLFGTNITKATIHWVNFVKKNNFIHFINTMPNLQELNIYKMDLGDTNVAWQEKSLNLQKLTILKLSEFYDAEGFLNIFPAGVLRKTSIECYISDYSSFFKTQFNIKQLRLTSFVESDALSNLQLQELSINCDDELIDLVKSQPLLLKLEIHGIIDRPILTAIYTHLKHLKTLSIGFFDYDEVTILSQLVSNLSKLAHLEELILRSYSIDIAMLTSVQHLPLKKLFLEIEEPLEERIEMDVDELKALKQAFPSLIELGLNNCVPTNVHELLNIFTDLETLSLRVYSYPERKKDLFIMKNNERTHESIKKFFFSFHHTINDLIDTEFQEFVCSMTNLEAFEIWNTETFIADINGLIFSLKKNLSKLKIFNVFKTDSYGIIHYPQKGSILPLYMCNDSVILHDKF